MLMADDYRFIQPGSTSRETVLMQLGEPDYASNDECILVYRWTTSEWVMAILIGNFPAIEVPHNRYLRIELDARGVVNRQEQAEDRPLKAVNFRHLVGSRPPEQ
jgi:hypothetical protein